MSRDQVQQSTTAVPGELLELLTPREREVVPLLRLPRKAICERLGISLGTLKAHIGAIRIKEQIWRARDAMEHDGAC